MGQSICRRAFMTGTAALVGVAIAGCGGRGTRTEENPTTVSPPEDNTSTQIPESRTDQTRTTTPTPELNRTPYPTTQQGISERVIPDGTAILTDDWRANLRVSVLEDETIQFLMETDFDSSFVVGFEATVDQVGSSIQLKQVERVADRVEVYFSDVETGATLNAYGERVVFLRLPVSDGVPERVELNRTEPLSQ